MKQELITSIATAQEEKS